MQFLYRIGLLLALAGGPLLTISSCSSEKKEDPQPTTGGLAGTVSPAGAISRVTATDAGGLTFLATPDASTGAFTIADLKPGSYTLSFTPATGYSKPLDRIITIVAGQQAAAGTVAVESDGSIRTGTVGWSADGVPYSTTTVQGGYTPSQFAGANTLTLLATTSSGTTQSNVDIRIDYLTSLAPATYQLRRTRSPGGVSEAFYSSTAAGASGLYVVSTGSLTITAYDTSTRVLTGTFAFDADGYNGTTGTVRVSNGSFRVQL